MIRKVLVYTYGDQSHDQAIRCAANFAKQNDAELIGLFVRPDVMGYSSIYGTYPLNLAQAFFDIQDSYCKKTKENFEQIVEKYDCRSRWHEINEQERTSPPHLFADILFVSQPNTDSNVIFNDTDYVDHLITATGLPVIMIPADWKTDTLGTNPVLGWKETREAASTVRQALPLLRGASEVHIVTINRHGDSDEDLVRGIEISEYLSEHGVNCHYFAERMNEGESSEASALIRHINDHGRDLLIIGGYGHSRFRQIVLGGMTRAMIRSCPVPLLMSH